MAKTVAEILRESGLTDDQIKTIDEKALAGFTQVIQTAEQERAAAAQAQEAAELAKRAQNQQYEEQIAPALNNWANEKGEYDTRMAAYQAALKAAADGGFAVPDILKTAAAPKTDPATGRFVAGGNEVPGSPKYMTQEEGYRALTNAQYVMAEYMRLNNGAPPPDDIEVLASEAHQNKMPLRDYAAKKYQFAEKREALKAAEQKKSEDAIRADERAKVTREVTERLGNNPMVRQAESSKFSQLDKGVKDGSRPDPLKLTREQRHQSTRANIQKEISENEMGRPN